LRATGTNTGELNGMPATGKKSSTVGVMTTKFDDGKVVEAWSIFDTFGLMQQLGIIPTPDVATRREPVLTGSR
ncbi:MAG TPA: ester cyclase, partial [Verrucomicrobiae bacterium]|nr:ester cyclase [Verrucomicrobiae bacterium]